MQFIISPVSENALLIRIEGNLNQKEENLIQHISALCDELKLQLSSNIEVVIPSYSTILVNYNFLSISYGEIHVKITEIAHRLQDTHTQKKNRIIDIPTYYSHETGPDLKRIAQHNRIDVEEVITLHSKTHYCVFAIGFTPGFAYMGYINSSIACPRLDTPRLNIPKGSVGIADKQTGIYPSSTPGGWNIIGHTLFNLLPSAESDHLNTPLHVGDTIQFTAIDKMQYHELRSQQHYKYDRFR